MKCIYGTTKTQRNAEFAKVLWVLNRRDAEVILGFTHHVLRVLIRIVTPFVVISERQTDRQ